MKLHGMKYLKIPRKYRAVTKIKKFGETYRFVFILFPRIKHKFQIHI